jgi:protein O-mannosyl-transferase
MCRLRGRSQNCENQESCPGDPGAAKARPRLIGLLLALFTLLAYMPVARDGFVNYDDQLYVTDNRVVQNGLTWAGVQWAFTHVVCSNWHPLTIMSHMLDCRLYGLSASGHHLTNVLLHTASVVLLFLVLREMTGFPWRSAFVAAVFAIHPLRVESVAWVAERKDVLSGLFFMLTLWAYVRHVRHPFSIRRYLAVVFLFSLALLSKPMVVTLPFVLLLLDYWPLNRLSVTTPAPVVAGNGDLLKNHSIPWQLILEKIPLLALSGATCMATMAAQEDVIVPVPLALRIGNAVVSCVVYLRQMFCPTELAVLYPYPQNGLPGWEITLAVVLLAAVSTGAFLQRRRRPYLLIGWLWYLGMLVPAIGLVQSGLRAHADRYTYLPQIGLYLLLTWAAADLCAIWRHRRLVQAVATAAAILVLAGCLVLTENQLLYWRDSESLFRHTLAVTKDNDVAHLNLGTAFQDEGRLNEALAEYRASAGLNPGYSCVHKNLGSVLDALGRPEEALTEYRLALQLEPSLPALHDGIGIVFVELGRFDEAMSEFSEAARLDPDYPWPYFQMGRALLQQGRDAEAIGKFHEALRINPDNFQILAFVARVLAADDKPGVRDGQTALVYAARANVLSDGAQSFVLDALGMACAEAGRFDDAREATQRAIDLAIAAKMNNLEPLQQRLVLYRNQQPWRESFLSTNFPTKEMPKK